MVNSVIPNRYDDQHPLNVFLDLMVTLVDPEERRVVPAFAARVSLGEPSSACQRLLNGATADLRDP